MFKNVQKVNETSCFCEHSVGKYVRKIPWAFFSYNTSGANLYFEFSQNHRDEYSCILNVFDAKCFSEKLRPFCSHSPCSVPQLPSDAVICLLRLSSAILAVFCVSISMECPSVRCSVLLLLTPRCLLCCWQLNISIEISHIFHWQLSHKVHIASCQVDTKRQSLLYWKTFDKYPLVVGLIESIQFFEWFWQQQLMWIINFFISFVGIIRKKTYNLIHTLITSNDNVQTSDFRNNVYLQLGSMCFVDFPGVENVQLSSTILIKTYRTKFFTLNSCMDDFFMKFTEYNSLSSFISRKSIQQCLHVYHKDGSLVFF